MGAVRRTSRRRPRGDGSRCSLRSSPALSYSTGLSSCYFESSGRVSTSVQLELIIVFVSILIGVSCLSHFPRAGDSQSMCNLDPPAAMVLGTCNWDTGSCWLGYAFNATLGYPGEGPPGADFDEETESWLAQLEEVHRLLMELPVVQKVDYYFDEAVNLNKVEATLWCCWASGQFKRVKEACDEKRGSKPTHVEAARVLLGRITKEQGPRLREPHS